MLKDIKSLIDHTNFNFERLDYLQNIFIGILSIEQNKVIKNIYNCKCNFLTTNINC